MPHTRDEHPLTHLELVPVDPYHDAFITPQAVPWAYPIQVPCQPQQSLMMPRLRETTDHLQLPKGNAGQSRDRRVRRPGGEQIHARCAYRRTRRIMGKRSRWWQILSWVIRGDLDLQAQQTWPFRQPHKPQARRPQEANLVEPLLQPQPQSAIAPQDLNT